MHQIGPDHESNLLSTSVIPVRMSSATSQTSLAGPIMDSLSVPLVDLARPAHDSGVAADQQAYDAIPSRRMFPPLRHHPKFIPLLSKDPSGGFSCYLRPVSALETPMAWLEGIQAMQTHGFMKRAIYFIAMRRDCIKVVAIVYLRNIDRPAEEALYAEQRVHVHIQDMQVDNGLTTAYNNPSSLESAGGSAIEFFQDFVTHSPLDLTREKLAIYVDQEFSGREALAWAVGALMVASGFGGATGFLKRDWATGLGIGLGLFGFLAAFQVVITWTVLSH